MTNPHSWVYLDVKDADGKVANWGFEPLRPTLCSGAASRRLLEARKRSDARGLPCQDGSHTANAQKLLMPDGNTIILGTEVNPG
jgi:hypothetical protein